MAEFKLIDDTYGLRARVAPALVVVLPLGLALAAWWPSEVKWSAAVGVIATLAVGTLLSHLGRDLGKQKEPKLFKIWGGKPTTQMLSIRASTINPLTLARYHSVLRAARSDLRLPRSKEDELRDTESADVSYESCTDYLRELAKDRKKHPVVFEENVSYGFRRNLWAMKPAAIAICLVGTLLVLLKAVGLTTPSGDADLIGCCYTVVSLYLLVLWTVRIRPSWIRVAAFAYAERLLAICETIEPKPPSRPTIVVSGK